MVLGSLCMCIGVFGHSYCMCRCTHIYAYVCGSWRCLSDVISQAIHHVSQTGHSVWACQLSWPVGIGFCMSQPLQVGCWGKKWGPHVCKATTLVTDWTIFLAYYQCFKVLQLLFDRARYYLTKLFTPWVPKTASCSLSWLSWFTAMNLWGTQFIASQLIFSTLLCTSREPRLWWEKCSHNWTWWLPPMICLGGQGRGLSCV